MACPRVGASSAENALKRLAEEGVIENLEPGGRRATCEARCRKSEIE